MINAVLMFEDQFSMCRVVSRTDDSGADSRVYDGWRNHAVIPWTAPEKPETLGDVAVAECSLCPNRDDRSSGGGNKLQREANISQSANIHHRHETTSAVKA